MNKGCRRWSVGLLLLAFIVGSMPQLVLAENVSPQSTNFRLDETVVGVGGLMNSGSNNYKATDSVGSLSVGNAASTNYQVIAGSKTTSDPTLSFIVNSSSANFGVFSAATPATATATFSVLNYTTFGYVVQVTGNSLTNNGHTITPMASTNVSQPGIEQFGINLVANTSPVSLGANLDNGGFGFGEISPNYAVPNEYRYVDGETIAFAPKNSGVTNYTISYLVNVASLTPGGQYSANQTLIVIGTY